MIVHEKAAGLAGLGGSVDRYAVAATLYPNLPKTTIEIDDGSYAIAAISVRFSLSASLASEVCRMAGIGVR
jgi:hypothetical protein